MSVYVVCGHPWVGRVVVCIRCICHRCMCCAHVQCDVYNVCTSCIIVLLSHYRLSPRGGRYYMVAAVPTERLLCR